MLSIIRASVLAHGASSTLAWLLQSTNCIAAGLCHLACSTHLEYYGRVVLSHDSPGENKNSIHPWLHGIQLSSVSRGQNPRFETRMPIGTPMQPWSFHRVFCALNLHPFSRHQQRKIPLSNSTGCSHVRLLGMDHLCAATLAEGLATSTHECRLVFRTPRHNLKPSAAVDLQVSRGQQWPSLHVCPEPHHSVCMYAHSYARTCLCTCSRRMLTLGYRTAHALP